MLRLVFMGVIAIFLLGLYSYAIWYTIQTLLCINANPACTAYKLPLGDGIKEFLSLIGGLVSALVISVLAITRPNSSPGATVVASLIGDSPVKKADVTTLTKQIIQFLTYLYLGVWLAGGIAMVIWGMALNYTTPVPELTSAAKSWLGLAITATYALFGLKPVEQ